ncbi:aminoglycoside phosphotransferase family protein [Patulibacter sp. NPDC049589]|uniref:aminoglycoside phosphotransferase family protein n=1 Tax=Patulibacter sp. NPDC049589 TaxID=3154731 RepID=UPI0034134166
MPDSVLRRLLVRHGADLVVPWWETLPERIASLAERWGVTTIEPIDRGNTAVLLRTDRGVLKLTPDERRSGEEAAALRLYAPTDRCVRLLDEVPGALRLEALRPVDRPITTGEAGRLVGALHAIEAPAGTPTLASRIDRIFDHATRRGTAWAHRRDQALALARRRGPAVLLHGDLHPGNLLLADRGLVVIDPTPFVGDPAWDLADLSRICTGDVDDLVGPTRASSEDVRAWARVFAADPGT